VHALIRRQRRCASDPPPRGLGADGEPFLRIGPGGTSANVRSATWRRIGETAHAADDSRDRFVVLRRGPHESRVTGVVEWMPSASGVRALSVTPSGD
jgi:hypothetical protein